MKFITIFKAGLEAFNDSLRIEASPVHLVLIEPGELFSLTPMSSKQTGHYQTMKAQRNSQDKEDRKFENLEAYFKSLDPGLGLISASHGVYRWVAGKCPEYQSFTCLEHFSRRFSLNILKDCTQQPVIIKGSV